MSAENMYERMTDWDGGLPPYWDPEEGEILVGKLLRCEQATTKLGDRRVAIILDHENNQEVSVWLSRSVLRNEFARLSPQPGDTVGVKFFGKQQPRDPTKASFFKYGVMVDRQAAPPAATPAAGTSEQLSISLDDDDLPL